MDWIFWIFMLAAYAHGKWWETFAWVGLALLFCLSVWRRSRRGEGHPLDRFFLPWINPLSPRTIRRRAAYLAKHGSDFERSESYIRQARQRLYTARLVNKKIESALREAAEKATDTGTKIPVEQVVACMKHPYDILKEEIARSESNRFTSFRQIEQLDNYWRNWGHYFEEARQNVGYTPTELLDLRKAIDDHFDPWKPLERHVNDLRLAQWLALNDLFSEQFPELRSSIAQLKTPF